MSGLTPWKFRDSRMRTLVREQRAAEVARHRELLTALRFQVWRLRIEGRFVHAMAAAAAGGPVDPRFRVPRDPHALTEQDAAKYSNALILGSAPPAREGAAERAWVLAATADYVREFETAHGPIAAADYAEAEAFLDAITTPTASKESA
jgi:hypothetical protein